MESKYYTPTIDEFYVGFEYEEYISQVVSPRDIIIVEGEIYTGPEKLESEWIKSILTDYYYDLEDIADIFNSKKEVDKLRVKYLDKEDIESLGFIDSNDQGMSENYGYLFKHKDNTFQKATYILKFWINSRRVRIERITGCIFDGTIKNLSEFKVLLKQLGIL